MLVELHFAGPRDGGGRPVEEEPDGAVHAGDEELRAQDLVVFVCCSTRMIVGLGMPHE